MIGTTIHAIAAVVFESREKSKPFYSFTAEVLIIVITVIVENPNNGSWQKTNQALKQQGN